MSENETIKVPIPAGDDNPEVKFLENQKQSRFDEPTTPPTTGLRASNTLKTLKPREVTGVGPEPVFVKTDGDYPFIKTQAQYEEIVRKTDNSGKELETNGEFYKRTADGLANNLREAKANVLPVNFPASAGLDGKPLELPYQGETGLELPKPKEIVYGPHKAPEFAKQYKPAHTPVPLLIPSLYDRVTKLEEQVDSLLDRIAKHNQRSSHKI